MQPNNNDDAVKINEQIASIKNEMKDIANRLANLKGNALSALYEHSHELQSALSEIKNKIMGQDNNQDSLKIVSSYIEQNPIKSALCCFAAGVALSSFFLRR